MVTKRSVSLDDEVASSVEEAARQDGVSFSAWLSSPPRNSCGCARGCGAWRPGRGRRVAQRRGARRGEALLARLRSGVSGVASCPTPVSTARREGLVYGLGALHAAARGDRMMWALHRAALSNGIVPVVPAVTVAEVYRTEARSDRIGELLAGTEVEPFSGDAARGAWARSRRAVTRRTSASWRWSRWPSGAIARWWRSARPCCGRRRRSWATSSCSTRSERTRRPLSGPTPAPAPGRSAGGGAARPRGSVRRR